MGVAGLWDVVRPAGKPCSLTELAVVQGFETNKSGLRGFRIGIDASIWFFHAAYGKEGENPELRTLFFRCATLMHTPFLPLFVFDGPKRPSVKRGKRIAKTSSPLTTGMKEIIESFGFEWRTAPGEAEAELAYLNYCGIIDGILSDDIDTFLFGATMVIRNPSNNLSGNRSRPVLNADGKDDKNHTMVYRLNDISNDPDIALTRPGFILIGLLRGGDYHQEGLPRCGVTIAHGLAKCGLGDSLFQAALNLSRDELPAFLSNWRNELRHELRTDSQGHIGRKYPSLAKSVPEDFPNIDILLSYTNPVTSESLGRAHNNLKITWQNEPNLGRLAATCEQYFEWGYKEAIIKRFRTVIWPAAVLRILRRAVLNIDSNSRLCPVVLTSTSHNPAPAPPGTPSKMITKYFSEMDISSTVTTPDDKGEEPLIIKIHSARKHASTDGILEYRLEIAPAQLVRLTEAGIAGTRRKPDENEWTDEDDGSHDEEIGGKGKKLPPGPLSHFRVWMPASLVRIVEPTLVNNFEKAQQSIREKKGKRRSANTKTGSFDAKPAATFNSQILPEAKVKPAKGTAIPIIPKSPVRYSNDTNDAEDIKNFFAVRKPTKVGKSKPRVQSTSKPSAPLHLQAKPFPMSSADSLPIDPFIETSSSPPSSPSVVLEKKPNSQKTFHPHSDSPEPLPPLKKSPRKSMRHTSPHSKRTTHPQLYDTLENDEHPSRPTSPSPFRSSSEVPIKRANVVLKSKPKFTTFIEISSDSDTSTKDAIPPLLLARAKARKDTNHSHQSGKDISVAKTKPRALKEPTVVIDLT